MPYTLLVVFAFVAAILLKWRPTPATYLTLALGAVAATMYFLR
ncbi:MAG TPA: hypothetical protein VGO86_05840 [Candidatus Dormibacteraeota bacterium]|jgi:hypothetical protein